MECIVNVCVKPILCGSCYSNKLCVRSGKYRFYCNGRTEDDSSKDRTIAIEKCWKNFYSQLSGIAK